MKKIGIVTGASSGIGREFVKIIIREQLKTGRLDELWLIGRSKERLVPVSRSCPGVSIRILEMDLTKDEDMEGLCEILAAEHIKQPVRIKTFVHSAGMGVMGQISELGRKVQAETVDLNCRTMVTLTDAVLPWMEQGGRMIYMSSGAAFLPQPGFAVYAASKAFSLSFIRALRREECERDMKITAVCPGAVDTAFLKQALGEKKLPAYKKLVLAKPEAVAKKAWKDNTKNRELSVYGPGMKAFYLMTKVLPHRLLLRFM